MEKKRIVITSPMVVAGITLILVIKLSVNCQPAGNNLFFSGVKQPVSLVISSPSIKKAFDIEGEEKPMGQLLQEVPELAGVLEIS